MARLKDEEQIEKVTGKLSSEVNLQFYKKSDSKLTKRFTPFLPHRF